MNSCISRFKYQFSNSERGASIIEMAVVTPFVLTLGLGIFEFGNILYQYQLIHSGVRDASRYLARFKIPELPSDQITLLETQARNLATRGTIDTTGDVRVSWWGAEQISITYPTIENPIDADSGTRSYRGGDQITIVRISTTATYNELGFLGVLGLEAPSVSSTHEERLIGD